MPPGQRHGPAHQERRRLLQHVALLADGVLPIVPSFAGVDVEVLLAYGERLQPDGVVIKSRGSRYRSGQSNAYIKAKCASWSEHRMRRFERSSAA